MTNLSMNSRESIHKFHKTTTFHWLLHTGLVKKSAHTRFCKRTNEIFVCFGPMVSEMVRSETSLNCNGLLCLKAAIYS